MINLAKEGEEPIVQLEFKDIMLLKICVDYSWHRILKHKKRFIPLHQIERLKEEFNNIKI